MKDQKLFGNLTEDNRAVARIWLAALPPCAETYTVSWQKELNSNTMCRL